VNESLTFDDVILIPNNFSTVKSRKNVDVSVNIKGFTFKHPIIPANMKTVTGLDMARAVAKSGGLTILNRFVDLESQIHYHNYIDTPNNVGLSLGVNKEAEENFESLYKSTACKIWCIDIAQAHCQAAVDMVQYLKDKEKELNENFLIIAGNIVTEKAARRLWNAGADVVKCGIGLGSACTSSVVAGHGRGQISAILEINKYRDELERHHGISKYIISDGGIQTPGDCVKALAAGADMVMIGNLFARCQEAPGETKTIDGKLYKKYEGSSTYKNRVEGVSGWVPCDSTYLETLNKLTDGIMSGCSYSGVDNISDLKEVAEFEKVTNNTLTLSRPHDIVLE
jgi:IMP dehydrogenase